MSVPVPGFPCVMSLYLSQCETGWLYHMSVPGFLTAMSFFLIAMREGCGLDLCLYLAFPLSCLFTYGKVKKGVVLTYVFPRIAK